ncbi:MAG: RNA ligase partner protein [Microgenomates group bacterium]|nr:RNA ligase partner protein [Microgenomates group bacterium]
MEKYVVDTNIFFNMEAGIDLGENTEEVVKNLTQIIKKTKKENQAEFLSPPSAIDEFLGFFKDKNQPFLKNFLSEIIIKSPEVNNIALPAPLFYSLISEIRQRSFRGLTIAEEEIIKAGHLMEGEKKLSKKDFQIKIGEVVRSFRERYRQATRTGFLDSLVDLDLIMLAKECRATLISTDEGVVRWGRLFGVKEMPPRAFGEKMKELLHRPE